MKKLYPQNFRRILSATIFLLTLSIIIYSCRKEAKETDTLQQPQQGLIQVDISALKDIYNKAINAKEINSDNSLINTTSANSNIFTLIKNLNVKWEKYVINNRIDSSKVIEFDMEADTGVVVTKQLANGDTVYYKNKNAVVFIKYKNGNTFSFFMKVIEDFGKTHKPTLDRLHYQQIPDTFTGQVLFYNLDKAFINGYRYTNGKFSGSIGSMVYNQNRLQAQSSNNLKTNVLQNPDCGWYDVYRTYTQYGMDGSIVSYDQQYLYSEYIDCGGGNLPGGGGGGAAGGDGNNGGAAGSGDYGCQVSHSIYGNIKTNVAQSGGGDDGGGSTNLTPCPTTGTNPQNNQIITVDHSITDNDKLNCIYSTIAGNSIYRSLTGAFASGNKYNLLITAGTVSDPNALGVTSHTIDNPNVTITINSSKVENQYALSIAETFIHEAFHANIDQLLIQRNLSNGNDFNGPFAQSFDKYILSQVDNQRTTYQQLGTPYNEQMLQHEIISNNINILARGLQEYVKSAFPNAYNDPSITFDNYVAYVWESAGLQGSTNFALMYDTPEKLNDFNNKYLSLRTSTTINCPK